jgi:Ca2+-binding EF-hand superfamily protein
MIVNNLIYGEMLEEQEKKEAEIKSMHFLNKRNDIVIEDESQKFLDVMNSLGFAMSKEELDKVLKNQ